MDLEGLKIAIFKKKVRITFHAINELREDNIFVEDVVNSINSFEIIEDYPSMKPFPACLILSFSTLNKPIHTVWAYDSVSEIAILITAYRPNPFKWVEFKIRKK